MTDQNKVSSYGVRHARRVESELDVCVENVLRNGYAVFEPGFSTEQIKAIQHEVELVSENYAKDHGVNELETINEQHTVRLPMAYALQGMLGIAQNDFLINAVRHLIDGTFILNQQNLIFNPSQQTYSQSSWHRDLPYQHFVSSTPLAINAIYCVDDFSAENGASFVLPGSHKVSEFPSDEYVRTNEQQLVASAGSYLLLDCMMFHRGGFNSSSIVRRAINQVYTIPYFKQQIAIPEVIDCGELDEETQQLLGWGMTEPQSVAEYLQRRNPKQHRRN